MLAELFEGCRGHKQGERVTVSQRTAEPTGSEPPASGIPRDLLSVAPPAPPRAWANVPSPSTPCFPGAGLPCPWPCVSHSRASGQPPWDLPTL